VEWALQFHGDLDGAQRTRLFEIAQLCPVHRTLRSEVHIAPPQIAEGGSASDGDPRR
jgi:uncharacterized OsmC-like protein